MSLDKREEKRKLEKTKTIEITGTWQDLEALADVIEQIRGKFNVDLEKDKDLPPRITIRDKIDPNPLMFGRADKLLGDLSKEMKKMAASNSPSNTQGRGLKTEATISTRDPSLMKKFEKLNFPVLKVMQNVTYGSSTTEPSWSLGKKQHGTLFDNFAGNVDVGIVKDNKWPQNMANGLFTALSPEWVYIQSIDAHPGAMSKRKGKKEHDTIEKMAELDADRLRERDLYPPDFGNDYTQGYVAVMRANMNFDLNQKIKIDPNRWARFCLNIDKANPELMNPKYARNPPKTIGDLLEYSFAYVVGRTMAMQKATVKPIGKGRLPIEQSTVSGFGEDEIEGTRVMYTGIVVGKGPYLNSPTLNAEEIKKHELYSVMNINDLDRIPGWIT